MSWGLLLAALWLPACHEPRKLHRVQAMAAFDQPSLDFGEVPVGSWQARQVTVRNIGHVPFSVDALQLSGNASFRVEVPDTRVPPGEERMVIMRFHPLQEGLLEEQLSITTDADVDPLRTLPVRGIGSPAGVWMEPSQLEFETLEIDSERTLELTIHNPSDLPLAVSVSGEGGAWFQAQAATVEPLSSRSVPVRYLPGALGKVSPTLLATPCPACTPGRAILAGNAVESAFSFDPSPVPFDEVPVHAKARSSTRATNITWRAVDFLSVSTSDPGFAAHSPSAGLRVEPGSSFPTDIEFSSTHNGAAVAELTVNYRSDRQRSSRVILDARGGMPQLALAPASIDFGTLPVGGKLERVVRLTNAGFTGDLLFKGVRASGQVQSFSVGEPSRGATRYPWAPGALWPVMPSPGVPVSPGADWLDVRVFFQPEQAGELRAELVFQSDDRLQPERTVLLTGRAYPLGACRFRVLPQNRLDFGNVPVGTGAVLGFRFENASTEPCAVKDIHLSDGAQGAFFMPGGPLTGGVVLQDDSFAAQVAFRPSFPGTFHGELSVTVSDPLNPVFRLPLRAMATDSCLVAVPNYLDFGPVRYDCAPEPQRALISNRCASPLFVTSVAVGPGTSDQFTVEAPFTPLTLEVGGAFEVKASYSRTVHGQHYSPLWLQAAGEAAPLLLPLLAETNHEGRHVERFVQGTDRQLDLLFVVANTTTMASYAARLEAAIPGLLAAAQRQAVDLQVAVTTTGLVPKNELCPGGALGGEAGRLFPVDNARPRIVSGAWPDAAALIQQNLRVGDCHNLVQGLETMRSALSSPLIGAADDPRTPALNDANEGLLRPAARLAVVFLADEDDHSGFDPESYIQFLRSLKGPGMAHRASAHALVPLDSACVTAGPPGPRFARVASSTGGETLSVCSASYAGLLERLAARAAGPQAEFVLAATPYSEGDLSVSVDGRPSPVGAWRLEPATPAIVFSPGALPAPGQTIEVRYRSACPPPR